MTQRRIAAIFFECRKLGVDVLEQKWDHANGVFEVHYNAEKESEMRSRRAVLLKIKEILVKEGYHNIQPRLVPARERSPTPFEGEEECESC
jgi:hypothetical protein